MDKNVAFGFGRFDAAVAEGGFDGEDVVAVGAQRVEALGDKADAAIGEKQVLPLVGVIGGIFLQ